MTFIPILLTPSQKIQKMDKKSVWQATVDGHLSIDSLPQWPCPRYVVGHLGLDKKDLLFANSRDLYRQAEFEEYDFGENLFLGILEGVGQVIQRFYWVQARFSALLRCSHRACNETIAVTGRAELPNPALNKVKQKENVGDYD